MATLRDHFEMIDLNPLVIHRERCRPPGFATAEEYHCIWYAITDRISYLPGGLATGKVTYYACFNDLSTGLQTHCYAPMGLDIKGKWTLGGNLPGEPRQAVELGVGMPKDGLWLREDVDFTCNIVFTTFVKRNLKSAHKTLVDRLVEKAKLREVAVANDSLRFSQRLSSLAPASPGAIAQQHPFGPPGSPVPHGLARPESMYSHHSSGHPTAVGSPALGGYAYTADGQPVVSPGPYHNVDPAYVKAMGFHHSPTAQQTEGHPAELMSTPRDPKNPRAARLPDQPVELAG